MKVATATTENFDEINLLNENYSMNGRRIHALQLDTRRNAGKS